MSPSKEANTPVVEPRGSFGSKRDLIELEKSKLQQLKIENHFKSQNQNGEAAETEIQQEDTNFDFDQSLCNDLQRILNQKETDSGAKMAGKSPRSRVLKQSILMGQG